MAADHPLRWIGGAALVVGLFVLGATSFQKRPETLALSLERTTVEYAKDRAEAVAKTSIPVTAPKLASHKPAARKPSERIARAPFEHVPCATIAQATTAPGISASSSGGNELTRTLRAVAKQVASFNDAVPTRDVRTIHGNQVAQLPPSVILLAARPLRGPPAV